MGGWGRGRMSFYAEEEKTTFHKRIV